ncbi:RNA polymerase I termination factor isoform X1 [Dendrobium catenatum]|uniref:RNA polymerase I termination factor isoform X1 n=2 Tax=Dendrobium catenatum TaxID=906689 RepID=UPI0009F25DCF|nr:RNA polymerase I termination factor isoform X1 [Dendrobium catenatum]
MHKSSRHNRSEELTSSANFLDEGMSCSENRATDGGFKEGRKYKEEHKKEKKKSNQKGITEFNSLKNASDEEGANLEDEIILGGPMQIEKDKKRHKKKKGNYKENENSTTFTENCNWDEAKEQDKKRKREGYFLEHELDKGSSKKMAKDASKEAYKVISGGNAEELLSRAHLSNKDKRKEKEKEYLASCTELTPAMTTRKEKGDQRSTSSTTKNFEKSKSDMNTLNTGKGCSINESYNCELKKDTKIGKKEVSFSDKVEFPLAQFINENLGPDNLVWGKRFTPEEDELIRNAVMDYIEANQLGEQGLRKVLHSRDYRREVKGCWKVIAAALPWRPSINVSMRARILFERSEERKWKPEELELIKRYHAAHGPKWKEMADMLGKSRVHVKDAWRRIRLPNRKLGMLAC